MTIDIEQLQIDLHALMMQTERDQAEFTRQLHLHGQIRQATAQLAEANAATLRTLVSHMTKVVSENDGGFPPIPYDDPPSIADRFAPSNGHQALQDVISRSYRNGVN
jgi:hypothetical protein